MKLTNDQINLLEQYFGNGLKDNIIPTNNVQINDEDYLYDVNSDSDDKGNEQEDDQGDIHRESDDDGIFRSIIMDAKCTEVAIVCSYLIRSKDLKLINFNIILDKLYNQKKSNIEMIRALKLINDLYYNNPIKYGVHGTRPALIHHFGRIASEEQKNAFCTDKGIQEVEKLLKDKLELYIKEIISALIKKYNLKTRDIVLQMRERIDQEKYIPADTKWRKELDLPSDQIIDYAEPIKELLEKKLISELNIRQWGVQSTNNVVQLLSNNALRDLINKKFTTHEISTWDSNTINNLCVITNNPEIIQLLKETPTKLKEIKSIRSDQVEEFKTAISHESINKALKNSEIKVSDIINNSRKYNKLLRANGPQ